MSAGTSYRRVADIRWQVPLAAILATIVAVAIGDAGAGPAPFFIAAFVAVLTAVAQQGLP